MITIDAKTGELSAQMESTTLLETLRRELKLTAQNARTPCDQFLAKEFRRRFEQEPAAAIEYAFERHRDRSAFFPAISQIKDGIQEWKADQRRIREELAAKQLRQQKKEHPENFVSYAEILSTVREVVERMETPQLGLRKPVKSESDLQSIVTIMRNAQKAAESPSLSGTGS